MSEHAYEDYDEVLPEEPGGDLVHWMAPRPMSFSLGALAMAGVGGFALGLATALVALKVIHGEIEGDAG